MLEMSTLLILWCQFTFKLWLISRVEYNDLSFEGNSLKFDGIPTNILVRIDFVFDDNVAVIMVFITGSQNMLSHSMYDGVFSKIKEAANIVRLSQNVLSLSLPPIMTSYLSVSPQIEI